MRLLPMGLMVGLLGWAVAGYAGGENPALKARIEAALQQAVPQVAVEKVRPSPVAGLYEVTLAGGDQLFATEDAGHFIVGDLFRLEAEALVNLSAAERDKARASRIAAIPAKDKITYSPARKKAAITVFTDIDCGYCQKLHAEMQDYLDAGIEVSYLAFPRAGVGSPSYDKIVTAWCADDRQHALTELKAGVKLAAKTCDNPVAEQYQLAQELGLRGTPAIILESGQVVEGYRPARVLARMLAL